MTIDHFCDLSAELEILVQISNNYKDSGARSEANAILYPVQKMQAILDKMRADSNVADSLKAKLNS